MFSLSTGIVEVAGRVNDMSLKDVSICMKMIEDKIHGTLGMVDEIFSWGVTMFVGWVVVVGVCYECVECACGIV